MFTEQPQRHEMVLVSTHQSGAEEWLCPTCGRRFLMQWPPEYKKIILETGDENAIHSGGKGGAQMDPSQISQTQDEEYLPEPEIQEEEVYFPLEEETLRPWEDWMAKVNFEHLWDRQI